MNLFDLLESHKDLNITINVGQLIEAIDYCILKTRRELEEELAIQRSESYFSAEKVCDMLDINMTTLWRWAKKDYLIPTKVGGKRRFKLSEVKAKLERGQIK